MLWLTEGGDRIPPRLCVAPLQVWGPMRDKLLTRQGRGVHQRDAAARRRLQHGRVELRAQDRASWSSTDRGRDERTDDVLPWRGLDVGSPFDYGKQAILYVASHLPPPGRDGLGAAQLEEIVELVDAAGGRTLGLFSSRRAAETAAEAVRERLPHLTTLAQGDAQLPELAKQFVEDPHTCLFGTLSLWQGLDVPGDTCQLVIIDRIPFPRPDDPLMSARQRAADKAGGNGFMQVAATHAALLLAQGSGRLIRTTTDKGVVAVLDPRLATARYGSFLKASLPPMWTTTDPAVVRQALTRLALTPLVPRCASDEPRTRRPARVSRETVRRRVVTRHRRAGRSRRTRPCGLPLEAEVRRHRRRDVDRARVPRRGLALRHQRRAAADEERDVPGRRVAVVAGDRVGGHRVRVAEAPARAAEHHDVAGLRARGGATGSCGRGVASTPGTCLATARIRVTAALRSAAGPGPVEEVGAAVVGDLRSCRPASGRPRGGR